MNTENLVVGALIVNNSSQGHVFKHVVKFLENRVGIVDIFTQASGALLAETVVPVHITVFVVTSQQEDLLGVLKLKRHQETDDLE